MVKLRAYGSITEPRWSNLKFMMQYQKGYQKKKQAEEGPQVGKDFRLQVFLLLPCIISDGPVFLILRTKS